MTLFLIFFRFVLHREISSLCRDYKENSTRVLQYYKHATWSSFVQLRASTCLLLHLDSWDEWIGSTTHTQAVLLQARRVRVLLPHFQQRFKNTYNKQTTFSSMFLSTFCVIFLCFGRIDSGSITHKSWEAEFFRYPRSSTPTSPRTMRFWTGRALQLRSCRMRNRQRSVAWKSFWHRSLGVDQSLFYKHLFDHHAYYSLIVNVPFVLP